MRFQKLPKLGPQPLKTCENLSHKIKIIKHQPRAKKEM